MTCLRQHLGRIGILAAVALASLAPAPAYAQRKGEEVSRPPYDVPALEHKKVILPWIFAFLFAVGVIAVAFKNPHRSHLD